MQTIADKYKHNMAKVISFVNQKGGTGKTTACVNIAAGLAQEKSKVLLIDLDLQANATLSLGFSPAKLSSTICEVLLNRSTLPETYQSTERESLILVPASPKLANVDISLEGHQKRLQEILKPYNTNFDYILIDCPPTLSLLTINGMAASDGLIIPVLCDYLSLEGLSLLLNNLEKIKQRFNPSLKIIGILLNMVDHRRNLTGDVSKEIKAWFKDSLFKTTIPVCVALAEAPSHSKDIFAYSSWSTGAKAYKSLLREIKARAQ